MHLTFSEAALWQVRHAVLNVNSKKYADQGRQDLAQVVSEGGLSVQQVLLGALLEGAVRGRPLLKAALEEEARALWEGDRARAPAVVLKGLEFAANGLSQTSSGAGISKAKGRRRGKVSEDALLWLKEGKMGETQRLAVALAMIRSSCASTRKEGLSAAKKLLSLCFSPIPSSAFSHLWESDTLLLELFYTLRSNILSPSPEEMMVGMDKLVTLAWPRLTRSPLFAPWTREFSIRKMETAPSDSTPLLPSVFNGVTLGNILEKNALAKIMLECGPSVTADEGRILTVLCEVFLEDGRLRPVEEEEVGACLAEMISFLEGCEGDGMLSEWYIELFCPTIRGDRLSWFSSFPSLFSSKTTNEKKALKEVENWDVKTFFTALSKHNKKFKRKLKFEKIIESAFAYSSLKMSSLKQIGFVIEEVWQEFKSNPFDFHSLLKIGNLRTQLDVLKLMASGELNSLASAHSWDCLGHQEWHSELPLSSACWECTDFLDRLLDCSSSFEEEAFDLVFSPSGAIDFHGPALLKSALRLFKKFERATYCPLLTEIINYGVSKAIEAALCENEKEERERDSWLALFHELSSGKSWLANLLLHEWKKTKSSYRALQILSAVSYDTTNEICCYLHSSANPEAVQVALHLALCSPLLAVPWVQQQTKCVRDCEQVLDLLKAFFPLNSIRGDIHRIHAWDLALDFPEEQLKPLLPFILKKVESIQEEAKKRGETEELQHAKECAEKIRTFQRQAQLLYPQLSSASLHPFPACTSSIPKTGEVQWPRQHTSSQQLAAENTNDDSVGPRIRKEEKKKALLTPCPHQGNHQNLKPSKAGIPSARVLQKAHVASSPNEENAEEKAVIHTEESPWKTNARESDERAPCWEQNMNTFYREKLDHDGYLKDEDEVEREEVGGEVREEEEQEDEEEEEEEEEEENDEEEEEEEDEEEEEEEWDNEVDDEIDEEVGEDAKMIFRLYTGYLSNPEDVISEVEAAPSNSPLFRVFLRLLREDFQNWPSLALQDIPGLLIRADLVSALWRSGALESLETRVKTLFQMCVGNMCSVFLEEEPSSLVFIVAMRIVEAVVKEGKGKDLGEFGLKITNNERFSSLFPSLSARLLAQFQNVDTQPLEAIPLVPNEAEILALVQQKRAQFQNDVRQSEDIVSPSHRTDKHEKEGVNLPESLLEGEPVSKTLSLSKEASPARIGVRANLPETILEVSSRSAPSTPGLAGQSSGSSQSGFMPPIASILQACSKQLLPAGYTPSPSIIAQVYSTLDGLSLLMMVPSSDQICTLLEEACDPQLSQYVALKVIETKLVRLSQPLQLYRGWVLRVHRRVKFRDQVEAALLWILRLCLVTKGTLTKFCEADHIEFLRNVGELLGALTLHENRPLKHQTLNLKEILLSALEEGALFVVVPVVAGILEGSRSSTVFKPKNPWMAPLLVLLCDIAGLENLKTSIKAAINNLLKCLGLSDDLIKKDTLSRATDKGLPPEKRGVLIRPGSRDFEIKKDSDSPPQVLSSRTRVPPGVAHRSSSVIPLPQHQRSLPVQCTTEKVKPLPSLPLPPRASGMKHELRGGGKRAAMSVAPQIGREAKHVPIPLKIMPELGKQYEETYRVAGSHQLNLRAELQSLWEDQKKKPIGDKGKGEWRTNIGGGRDSRTQKTDPNARVCQGRDKTSKAEWTVRKGQGRRPVWGSPTYKRNGDYQ